MSLSSARTHVLVGRAALALSLSSAILSPGAAFAEETTAKPSAPSDVDVADRKARASALFDEAVSLGGQGRFAEACTKLETSLELYEANGTAFNLAGCWEKIGRTASAHALFEKVAQKTAALGQTERADAARARQAALGPQLSRLRVDVEPGVRTTRLEVTRNGEIVPESAWGKSIPVDPGTHEVVVKADGRASWLRRVEVTDPGVTYAVTVSELAAAKPATEPRPAPAPSEAPRHRTAPEPLPPQPGSGSDSTRLIVAGTLATVGVVGLGGGIWFATRYKNKNDQAEAVCPASFNCTQSEINRHSTLVSDAKQMRTWTYVGVGVGGAALAGAAYVFLSGSSKGEHAGKASVRPELLISESGPVGAALSGEF